MTTRRRNGFALLMTLWLLVPIALSLLSLSGVARLNAEIAANERSGAVLRAAADGGIETAVASLLADRNTLPSVRMQIGSPVVTVAVEPLSGLLNSNLAPADLLRALLVQVGAAPARADLLAASIVEWRSPGQVLRARSTKAAEYRSEGLDYGPPGAPAQFVAVQRSTRRPGARSTEAERCAAHDQRGRAECSRSRQRLPCDRGCDQLRSTGGDA